MQREDRGSEWQVFGAVALIALGVMLFLNRVGGPWWQAVRSAFRFAGDVGWPLVLIAVGVLLLFSAKQGGITLGDGSGKRLMRSRSERMIGGVLGGLASYLGVDPTLVRIVYVVFAVITGLGLAVVLYLIAMVLVPEEPRPAPQQPTWPESSQSQVPGWAQPQPGATETVETPPPPPAPPTPPAPPVG